MCSITSIKQSKDEVEDGAAREEPRENQNQEPVPPAAPDLEEPPLLRPLQLDLQEPVEEPPCPPPAEAPVMPPPPADGQAPPAPPVMPPAPMDLIPESGI